MSFLRFFYNIRISIAKDKLILRVNCNENAMRYWALQYGPVVEILEPESLRNRLIEDMHGMIKRYSD